MSKPSPFFSEDYKESCFYAWYKAGRPKLAIVFHAIPLSTDGHRPTVVTLRNWMNSEGWIERADALDAEVSLQLDREAIKERADQLRHMADVGREVMEEGRAYLKKEGFDSSAAAVRAVSAGSDMVFRFASAADYLTKIGGMSNKQLETEMRRLLGKNEGEVSVSTDVIDADSTDLEDEDMEDVENADVDGA